MELDEQIKDKTILIQFKSETGELIGDHLDIPRATTTHQLQLICNALLQKVS